MKQDAPEASNRVGEVHVARDANALAAVQALELGEELDVALHEVGELVEEACALLGTGVEAPGRLEGLARRGDGSVDVGQLGVCDGGDGLAVGRVEDLERGRVGGVVLLREEGEEGQVGVSSELALDTGCERTHPFVVEEDAGRYCDLLAVELDLGRGGHGREGSERGELMRTRARERGANSGESRCWGERGGSSEKSACSREHPQGRGRAGRRRVGSWGAPRRGYADSQFAFLRPLCPLCDCA